MKQGAAASPDGKLRRLAPGALAPRLHLLPDHRRLLADAPAPAVLLRRFGELQLRGKQVALLGYALPEREAVWWACMCVEHTARDLTQGERRALDLTRGWVWRPDDAGRLACRQAAKAAGPARASSCAARAAFRARLHDSGSLAAGRLVEQAVMRAASVGDAAHASARLARFIGSGQDIAAGGHGRLPAEAAG